MTAETNPETAVQIKGVTKRYGDRTAVDQLSIDFPKGSIYGLLGPNGAGKTTTLGICCGLIHPDRGDVTVCGTSMIKDPEKARQDLGLLTQKSAFHPDRSALDHLVLYGRLSGIKNAKEAATTMLKKVGLDKRMHNPVRKYSHGMAKLLNLAQAFLAEPKVVFLDEPIEGLDPLVAAKVKDMIREHKGKTTIILSSHYLEAVEKLCTHVAIMNEGKLLTHGTLKDVRKGKSLEEAFLKLLK
jgi:ABC-2 type transport system ATP-binding protein